MRRIWAALALIAIVFVLCFCENIYLNKAFTKTEKKLDTMTTQFNNKEYEKAASTAKSLEKSWIKSEKFLRHFISTSALDEVGTTVSALPYLAKAKNDEFLVEKREVEVLLRHIMDSEQYVIY